MSRPTWTRELKQMLREEEEPAEVSRPTWARELKHHQSMLSNQDNLIVSKHGRGNSNLSFIDESGLPYMLHPMTIISTVAKFAPVQDGRVPVVAKFATTATEGLFINA